MSNDLDGFFHPGAVALIGATDHPLKPGAAILENLSHYRGAVYPVNPRHERLLGLRCYPAVTSVPGEIDLAIVALPAGLVEQEFERLHEKGIRRAIVVSSGFAEEPGGPDRDGTVLRGDRSRDEAGQQEGAADGVRGKLSAMRHRALPVEAGGGGHARRSGNALPISAAERSESAQKVRVALAQPPDTQVGAPTTKRFS